MFQVLRLIGTRRALDRLTRAYRSANSFTRAETVMLGQSEARVRITPRMPHPEVHAGILAKGIEEVGERSVQVAIEGFEGPDGETAVFRVAWGAGAQAAVTGSGAGTR